MTQAQDAEDQESEEGCEAPDEDPGLRLRRAPQPGEPFPDAAAPAGERLG
jgi:hypothetical protein